MRIRLYLDEDTSRESLVRELRVRGTDVVSARDASMVEKTDEEQLCWAAEQGRVLYSFNRGHFYGLHTRWLQDGRRHSGLILSKQNLSVGEQMRRLLRLIGRLRAEDMINRVEFLSSWNI